ncbi:MAG: hypothetical protein BGN88_15470 [Clostridiales bacterium 43-6]|nr:MAG: hypothetical protein BGN88_15470 [Clostridiales bacterium 43-6]
MIVYLDVLLALNLFVNYFLLLSTSKINNIPVKMIRLLLGAAFGALISLTIFLPDWGMVFDTGFKIVMSVCIVVIAFSYKSTKRFLRVTGTFFGVSFLYAGIMLAVWFAFRPDGMAINNGVVYFNISPLLLIVSTLLCYGVISLIRLFTKRQTGGDTIYELEIGYKDKIVRCKALLDTGNSLMDLFTNAPVVVAEYGLVEYMLPLPAREVFAGTAADVPKDFATGYRLIPYSAVGGKGLLPAFKPEYVKVSKGNKSATIENVLIAVSKDKLSDDFKALISEELLTDF